MINISKGLVKGKVDSLARVMASMRKIIVTPQAELNEHILLNYQLTLTNSEFKEHHLTESTEAMLVFLCHLMEHHEDVTSRYLYHEFKAIVKSMDKPEQSVSAAIED